MNKLTIFKNEEFGEIRTVIEGGVVLFCGSDIARALGYTNPRKALADHCKGVTKRYIPTNSGEQEMSFIPESDIYRLIFRSKLPGAERFTDWVTSEVLPSIRRNGGYIAGQGYLTDAEIMAKALLVAQNTIQQRDARIKCLEGEKSALVVDNAIMQPKADYFDELVKRNTLTSIRETAKELGVKERPFVCFLLEKRYLYRDKKGKLMPYAQKNDGLFEVKECFNEATQWSGTQTLVTPKGRETFRLLCQGL